MGNAARRDRPEIGRARLSPGREGEKRGRAPPAAPGRRGLPRAGGGYFGYSGCFLWARAEWQVTHTFSGSIL